MKIKYSDFAKALELQRASVTMAIKNGKLIADENNKLIDINIAENKIWIEAQVAKGKKWDLNAINKSSNSAQIRPGKERAAPKKDRNNGEQRESIDLDSDPHHFKLRLLEYEKKQEDIREKRNANILKELDIKKRQGKLVPVDAVEQVFLFSVETMRTVYMQEVTALASILVERTGASDTVYKEMQRELTEKVNDTMKDVKETLLSGLAGIIEEYKELKGRGEKS